MNHTPVHVGRKRHYVSGTPAPSATLQPLFSPGTLLPNSMPALTRPVRQQRFHQPSRTHILPRLLNIGSFPDKQEFAVVFGFKRKWMQPMRLKTRGRLKGRGSEPTNRKSDLDVSRASTFSALQTICKYLIWSDLTCF